MASSSSHAGRSGTRTSSTTRGASTFGSCATAWSCDRSTSRWRAGRGAARARGAAPDAGSSVAGVRVHRRHAASGSPEALRDRAPTSLAMLTLSMFCSSSSWRCGTKRGRRSRHGARPLPLSRPGGRSSPSIRVRMRVTVGADGVHLHQAITGSRFISFRDLASVSMEEMHHHAFDSWTIDGLRPSPRRGGGPSSGTTASARRRARRAHPQGHAAFRASPAARAGSGAAVALRDRWIQHASALAGTPSPIGRRGAERAPLGASSGRPPRRRAPAPPSRSAAISTTPDARASASPPEGLRRGASRARTATRKGGPRARARRRRARAGVIRLIPYWTPLD